MLAKKHHLSLEFEMIRWMVIIVLAGILALAVASEAWGNDVVKRSRPPVAAVTERGQPSPGLSALPAEVQFTDSGPEARQLWSALAYHRGNDPAAARDMWYGIQLPYQNEAWQHVALGVTYLQEGDCDAATVAFQVAKQLQPKNPVPSYFMGIVRLTQAQRAEDWHDPGLAGKVQFASLHTPDVVPNSKAMYEWVAMAEFNRALKLAHHVALDHPLLASAVVQGHPLAATQTDLPPTVGDLLVALGADNFAGKAHNTLGSMLVSRGALESAEQHLDDAAATGLTIVHGYADLGAAFEDEGQHSDAVRAFMKAVSQGDHSHATTHGVVENFGKALFNMR